MNVLRNKHAYIIINGSYEGICVEFEQKTTTLDFLLSNCQKVLKIFYDWPVKYYFSDDFDIWYMECSSVVYIFHKGIIS